MKQCILENGKGHGLLGKHRWVEVKSKKEYKKRGLKPFFTDGYFARWINLYTCECGAEMYTDEAGLL